MKRKPLTRIEKAMLADLLAANGEKHCTHPDCDPKQPSCAVNSIYLRTMRIAEEAFRLGRREATSEAEP